MYPIRFNEEAAPKARSESRYVVSSDKYKLGKYYTPQDVIDFILATCIKRKSDKVLDPSCGPGGFLIRAFSRLAFLNRSDAKIDLSGQIWGVDLDSKSVALARENLSEVLKVRRKNSIHVLHRDFFDVQSPSRKQATLGTWCEKDRVSIVDAVVGNPPYTRQEELALPPFGNKYKDKLREVISQDYPYLKISKMAGIYAYFLIHAASFLPRDGARLGFVTLRSWIDTRYGADLQRFLLKHFKILFIIESDVEKWFTDAQMLPCIVVAETCNNAEHRNSNLVKFVRLKQPLSAYWSPKSNNEEEHWQKTDNFALSLENAEDAFDFSEVSFLGKKLRVHESSSIRIVMIQQRFLIEDIKWGKYLVAPMVFFKILERANVLLTPLSEVATVYRGVTTGANNFFLFPNKFFGMKEKGGYLVLLHM